MAVSKRIGVCLTVGVNTPNMASSAYKGVKAPPLNGCVLDSDMMMSLATKAKFKTMQQLTEASATRDAVLGEIRKAATALEGNRGLFLFHFSGHGMRGIPGGTKQDSTGRPISCMLLRDGPLASFELYKEWSNFSPGVRILVLSDSCHSGRVVKNSFIPRGLTDSDQATIVSNNSAFFNQIQSRAALGPADVPKAPVVLISGCKIDEFSSDTTEGGLFTTNLMKVWKEGGFDDDYDEFRREIRDKVNQESLAGTNGQLTQRPEIFFVGAQGFEDDMALFLNQKPFTI